MAYLHIDTPLAAKNLDHSAYPLVVEHGGVMIASDSHSDLVSLLPGMATDYRGLDPDQAFAMRVLNARDAASQLQQHLVRMAERQKRFSLAHAHPDVVSVLRNPTELVRLQRSSWDEIVPLILLTVDFAPHTDLAPMLGNVWWLDPVTDETYLASLSEASLIRMWRADPDWRRQVP